MSNLTIWRKAYNLIDQGDWWTGEPHHLDPVRLKDCYCAGGAIAKALTGDAWDMYYASLEDRERVHAALGQFADHVGSTTSGEVVDRVWQWNDHRANKGKVLKALEELDALESAK